MNRGTRSCEPHLKAEHMAAPTDAANVKKALANSGPSTHGTFETSTMSAVRSASGGKSENNCLLRDLRHLVVTNSGLEDLTQRRT